MSSLRITLTDEIERMFGFLEKKFKPLSRGEIVEFGLRRLYEELENLPIMTLSERKKRDLEKSLADFKKGRHTILRMPEEVEDHFNFLV